MTLAASFADSGYLAGRQEWMLKGDPDLKVLRDAPQFKRFQQMYFPHIGIATTASEGNQVEADAVKEQTGALDTERRP